MIMAGYLHTALLLLIISTVVAQDIELLGCDSLCEALCEACENERDACLQFCNAECSDSLAGISALDKIVDSSTGLISRRDVDLALRGDEVKHRDKRFIGQFIMDFLQFESKIIGHFWDFYLSLVKWPYDIAKNVLQITEGILGFDGNPQEAASSTEKPPNTGGGVQDILNALIDAEKQLTEDKDEQDVQATAPTTGSVTTEKQNFLQKIVGAIG